MELRLPATDGPVRRRLASLLGRVAASGRRAHRLRSLVTIEHADDRARVLVVTSGWPRPDAPSHCIFIARQMDSLATKGVRYETLLIHGYRSKLAYLVAALYMAAMNIRPTRYGLVHAHGGEAALAACLYRRAPSVISYLGGDLLGNSYRPDAVVTFRGRLRRWLIRRSAHFARATITKSAEMGRALPARAQARNRVIPNGVDTDVFRPVNRESARRRLGWSHEKVALFVGNPAELRKRYDLAARAVAAAEPELGDVRLAIAHGVEPELIPLYMNAADCLLLLSWMEGSPNVVKEALMCNLPVIATAVGDVPELLNGVEPSYLVDPTCESVASALIACLRSPVRSNGRDRSPRLSATAVADEVLATYRLAGAYGVIEQERADRNV